MHMGCRGRAGVSGGWSRSGKRQFCSKDHLLVAILELLGETTLAFQNLWGRIY